MKIVVGHEKNNASGKSLEMTVKHAKAFGGEILLANSISPGDKPGGKKIIDVERDLEQAKVYRLP